LTKLRGYNRNNQDYTRNKQDTRVQAVADTRIEQGIAEKFGPAPPPTTEGGGGGREEGATKRPVYTLEDKRKGIPPPPGWEPQRPLRPEEAMKLIAGDDWMPLKERKKAERETAQKAGGVSGRRVGKDEDEEEDTEEEVPEGQIDVNTYGLDEPDEDEDPRNWKKR